MADKYRFSNGSDEFHPVDYARTAEHRWYKDNASNSFVAQIYAIAQELSHRIKTEGIHVQQGNRRYQGPVSVEGLTIDFVEQSTKPGMSVNMDTGLDSWGELVIPLPQHKIRLPIDSLVAGKQGLQRISEMQPTLKSFAEEQTRWLGSAVARLALPRDVIGGLVDGINRVNQVWFQDTTPEPLLRPFMPKDVLSDQISRARTEVADAAYRPTFS